LLGQALALNLTLQLHRDRAAPARTRRATGRLLGHPAAAADAATVAAPADAVAG